MAVVAELRAPGPKPAGEGMQTIFFSETDRAMDLMPNCCAGSYSDVAAQFRGRGFKRAVAPVERLRRSACGTVRGCRYCDMSSRLPASTTAA